MACAPGINHKGLNKQIQSIDFFYSLRMEKVFELHFYEEDIIKILTC